MNYLDLDQERARLARAERGYWVSRMVANYVLVGILGAVLAVGGAAYAAFPLNVPQGPSLGDNFVNPYTLAKAINEGNQRQATAGLTAKAGGGQTSATQLALGINEVSVVATAADSVQLPACVPGTMVFVVNNDASDSMTVYGQVGRTDTINGTAGATGVAQAAAARAWYVCISTASATQGAWVTLRASS